MAISNMNDLNTAEKVRILCSRFGMTIADLAEKTGQSRQNLSNKISRGHFTEADLKKIGEAFGCTYVPCFITEDGEIL